MRTAETINLPDLAKGAFRKKEGANGEDIPMHPANASNVVADVWIGEGVAPGTIIAVGTGGLRRVRFTRGPETMPTGTVTLAIASGASRIRVWRDPAMGAGDLLLSAGNPSTNWILAGASTWSAIPTNLWVEGVTNSASAGDIALAARFSGPSGVLCADTNLFTVIRVGMTAYRPTTELPAYGHPFAKHEVPDDQEETPGAGIRVNGDTESGANENDLIEVELKAEPYPTPSGLTYVLKRQNSNIKVWDSRTMGTAILDSGTEETITFSTAPKTVWVENPSGGSADLELIARSGTTDVCSDKVHFYPFTSIVIALGGEDQVPTDPPDANHGVFHMAIDLYEQGYDVHMYDEDDVGYDGAGATYNEVVSAIQHRNVTQVAIFGYSHGGGSTFHLADHLNDNRGTIGTFTIPFTAYIDAVEDNFGGDMNQERRRPPSSANHVNYYQEGVAWPPWDPNYD